MMQRVGLMKQKRQTWPQQWQSLCPALWTRCAQRGESPTTTSGPCIRWCQVCVCVLCCVVLCCVVLCCVVLCVCVCVCVCVRCDVMRQVWYCVLTDTILCVDKHPFVCWQCVDKHVVCWPVSYCVLTNILCIDKHYILCVNKHTVCWQTQHAVCWQIIYCILHVDKHHAVHWQLWSICWRCDTIGKCMCVDKDDVWCWQVYYCAILTVCIDSCNAVCWQVW